VPPPPPAPAPARPPQPRSIPVTGQAKAKAARSNNTWVRQWLVPILVALALIAMIVIGLITALGADDQTSAPALETQMTHTAAERGIINAESMRPQLGRWEERY
jgi:hypothetical protein